MNIPIGLLFSLGLNNGYDLEIPVPLADLSVSLYRR